MHIEFGIKLSKAYPLSYKVDPYYGLIINCLVTVYSYLSIRITGQSWDFLN